MSIGPCTDFGTALVCFENASGNFSTLIAHYEYGKTLVGSSIVRAVRYTTADGTPVDTSAGIVTPGSCPVPVTPTPDRTVYHNSWNIASGAFAGSHDPAGHGAFWSYANVQQTGRLKSVSVTVYEGDAMAVNSIEIRHGQPLDKSWLLAGQSEDWDVSEDHGVDPLLDPNFEIECLGDSACFVSWTEEA